MNLINQLRELFHTDEDRENSRGMFVEVLEALTLDGDELTEEIDQFVKGDDTPLRDYVYTTLYDTSHNQL